MNIVFIVLLVIASILSFFLCYQFGRNRTEIEKMTKCLNVEQPTAAVANVAPIEPAVEKECIPAAPGMCSDFKNREVFKLKLGAATTPEDVFSYLHHPSGPAKQNFYYTTNTDWKSGKVLESPCQEVYLTRAGSRASQPNKCTAVAIVPEGYTSINQQSYRVGYTALNTDQYQKDYLQVDAYKNEKLLLVPLLQDLEKLVQEFKRKMGDPIDSKTGQRRKAIVMVANEGVLDLLLNFLCSMEGSKLDISQVIVFVGDHQDVALLESLGVKAMYSPSLGSMPEKAAGGYLDQTFSRMMWFKTTSVYLALRAGFEVLFQDVDLVWLKDPFPHFEDLPGDMIFMDDGARTPRYTPFFVNSGFYFVKYNERTLFMFEKMMKCGSSEIGQTHSHQSVLIRHIAESHHLVGLKIYVLDTLLFPSGQAYHENKPLIKKIQEHTYKPYVFHMCWTDNRENKVVYFKDVGLWYLNDEEVCNSGEKMLQYTLMYGHAKSVRDKCCVRERYWPADSV